MSKSQPVMESQRDLYTPLVSVGIPTYNRPKGLQKTLEFMTNQSYGNLEIIICDNASEDPEVLDVVRYYQSVDSRIIYYKQEKNIGPVQNFLLAVKIATGDFFMWAADDDRWEDFFVETAINAFRTLPDDFIAVNCEAQYFDKNTGGNLPFFTEGEAFYRFASSSPITRLKHVFINNYGNLVYSVFRMHALRAITSLKFCENEIPIIFQLSNIGNWRILPKVGWYKAVKLSTYDNLKWEVMGGVHPRQFITLRSFVMSQLFSFQYHFRAFKDILSTIKTLNLSGKNKWILNCLVGWTLFVHLCFILFGYKPLKK